MTDARSSPVFRLRYTATRYHSLIVKRETLPDCLEISAETDGRRNYGASPQGIRRSKACNFIRNPSSPRTGLTLLRNFLGMRGGRGAMNDRMERNCVKRQEEAVISVYDHGFLYGMGLFETFRTYGGQPYLLERHLERLAAGCRSLGIRYEPDAEEHSSLASRTDGGERVGGSVRPADGDGGRGQPRPPGRRLRIAQCAVARQAAARR